MNQILRNLVLLIFCGGFASLPTSQLYALGSTDWKRPLFSPAAMLIYDPAVRSELDLSREQTPAMDQLCDELDPLLFSMRDVSADTKDPDVFSRAREITEKLKQLDRILNSSQQKRLSQIVLQYQGVDPLMDPQIQSLLRFTTEQIRQMQVIHRQTMTRLQKVIDEQPARQDPAWARKRNQLILLQKTQKMLDVLGKDQQTQWMQMLGDGFDFSQVRPMSFQAPELKNVTEWINTQPVSMDSLKGRVVVVHFWTFGCSNCIQNYPVYKQWAKRYDSKDVLILGIHTPEAKYETDTQTLRERMKQEGLSFGVAVDNDKTNWDAWSNRIWPSVYLVDKKGRVRYWWYGQLKWKDAAGDQWMTERIDELKAE